MKKPLTLIALLLCLANIKAQTVTVADTAFAHWLRINVPSAMNGDQLDTTNSHVTSMRTMIVQDLDIVSLDGVQYFDSLTTLNCSNILFDTLLIRVSSIPALPPMLNTLICDNNALDSLPTLPGGLAILKCSSNPLRYLPTLPPTLKSIDCVSDSLRNIPALPASIITLNCGNNIIDSLPALPVQLVSLNCAGNRLTSLPLLPDSLRTLNCNFNQLQSLPVLPNLLNTLLCTNNNLSSLPALPNSLINMDCSYNQITALPVLPPNLPSLLCNNNQLSTLPALPNAITFINCSHNQINVLPTLPNALYKLNCNQNQLPALPALPNTLAILHCSDNQLPVLPALPTSLLDLECKHNQLPALPALPASLSSLNCGANQITALPVLPASLISLVCSVNLLDSLPPLPGLLNNLYCDNNSMTILPSLPASLSVLFCFANQLSNLPTLPLNLIALDCSYNNIHCFDHFGNISFSLNISNNPFTCIPNYIPSMDIATLNVPLCQAGNPFGCPSTYGIVGFTYKDNNATCLKDSGDTGLKNIPMKIYDASSTLKRTTFTALNGVYQFMDSAGVYSVVVDTTDTPFDASCIYPGLDSTLSVAVLDTNVNFALTCRPGFDVGTRCVSHCGIVFPGQTHTLRVNAGDMSRWYNLYCAAGISGTVKIEIQGPVSCIGPAPGALVPIVTGNTFVYPISDFAAINNSDFQLLLQPYSTAQAGDAICISVRVTPLGGDNNPSNNTYTTCYPVVNSYDPNIKETYPEEVEPNYADWLTYTIYFQNTGNAPAFNIRLADTLDQDLDLSTFQVTGYSHDNTTTLNGNILSVQYANIMLPDSTSDPEGSIGFIQYRLKPKSTWTDSRKIKNTAYIYFDFNAPIVTNSTYNKIMKVTGLSEKSEIATVLYPNPSNGSFTIELNTKEKQSLQLFDITGNIVLCQTIENGKSTIDATHLAAGIYTMSIQGNNSSVNKKLVIVK